MPNDARRKWLESLGVKFPQSQTSGGPPAAGGPRSAGLVSPTNTLKADAVSSSLDDTAEHILQEIIIDPPSAQIVVGGEPQQFTATGNYIDGTSELLTTLAEWKSSEPNHVSIDKNGRVTAKPPGQGQVTLTAAYEKSRGSTEKISASVTIRVVALTSIQIEPVKPVMPGGSRLQFKAMGAYSEGPRADLSKAVEWSTSKPDVVLIDGRGLATAKNVIGNADITAKTTDGRFSSTTGVSVTTPTLKALAIEPERPPTIMGELQFTAKGIYALGGGQPDYEQDETDAVEWSALPADVLSVENAIGKKGLAKAVKGGRAQLTVTEPNSKKTASINVAVAAPKAPEMAVITSIVITPPIKLLVGTRKLKAMARWSDNNETDVTRMVKWSSSAPNVVEIGKDGEATAKPKSGAATLKATYDSGKSAEMIVTVQAPVMNTISVYADGSPVIGKQQQFHATGELSDGTSQVMAGKVAWKSSDPNVIAVDPKTGLASIKTSGSATITAEDGSKPPVVGWSNVVIPPSKPPGPLTQRAVDMLIQNLVYLSNKDFYRASERPGPPHLQTAGEPSVDGLLGQAADAVRLWADRKTLPAALDIWRGVEPRLLALLKKAEEQPLGYTPQALKPARDAIARIADLLSMQEADMRLDQETKDTPTPELSKELDERELKKLEPALKAWKEVAQSGGRLAGPEMKNLSQALDIYFSTPDPEAKLHAFQHAHLLEEESTLPHLVAFMTHNCVAGGAAVTEAGIKAAEAAVKAGHHEAEATVEALEKRLKIVHAIGGAVALFDLAKGTMTLIKGIEKGDWHEIAEGAATIAMGAAGAGETLGIVAADTSAFATAGVVAAWAAFDSILMAAEIVRWGKQMTELTAFKALVADARKLVPTGKRMAAAVKLMQETENAADSVGSGNHARYEQEAKQDATKIGNGLRGLLDHHINRNDPHAVGGYPGLVRPVFPMLKRAYDNIEYGRPETLVDAFDATVTAIQQMIAAEAAANDVE